MKEQAIAHYYEEDHDRLEDLFKKFQHHKRLDFSKAKPFFRDFKFGLQRHIIWEDEILFPLFEESTGINGPTHVMRIEHRQIEKYLEDIHQKVKTQNPNSDDNELLLLNILSLHNQKEESILYPAIDRALNKQNTEIVFKRMNEIPEERYKTCCNYVAQK